MCDHQPSVGATCGHLADEYCEWFTGRGLEHDLVCPACAAAGQRGTEPICARCAAAAIAGLAWNADHGVIGIPSIAERDDGLAFVHERVELAAPLPAPILDLQPAPGPEPVLYAFLADGGLHRIDLARRATERVAELAARRLHMVRAVALALAPDGRAAGIVNDEGGHGVVVALDDGRETMTLTRGDFRPGDRFPLALGVLDGRTLAVHATRWNRLDVSDAMTGELLSARTHGMAAEGERLPHYLDLRHGALAISPDGERVADAGESEDGLYRVATFSLRRMLSDDPWESEDGASRREHVPRWYAPDSPIAWLDDRHILVGGYGPSASCLVDAACVCDAASGALVRWFAGPRGQLVVTGDRLASVTPDGTQVWDPRTGERLLEDRSLVPQRYHAGAGCFVTTNPTGEFFVRSTLVARG